MATLKISDLSVGDWVEWKVYDKSYDILVTQITDTIIRGVHDGIEYGMLLKQISPIPITPEILEKNGFVDNGVGQHYLKCGNGITARVGRNPLFRDDCWLVATDKQVDETISTTCVLFDAKHIHQLQHVLRLAGVDKEINL